MANFLRKFVKSKSRSKSPAKHYYYHPSSNYPTSHNDEPLINENEASYFTSKLNYCNDSSNYNEITPFINPAYLSSKRREQHLYELNDLNENEYISHNQQHKEILSHENCSPHSPFQSNKYLNYINNKNSKKSIKQQHSIKNHQNYVKAKPFSQIYSTLDHNNKPVIYDDILTEQYNQVKTFIKKFGYKYNIIKILRIIYLDKIHRHIGKQQQLIMIQSQVQVIHC